MELHPMKRYGIPDYPTRDVLCTQPELLRIVPQRWRRNGAVLAALAAAGLLAGCRTTRTTAVHEETSATTSRIGYSKVAPLFEHGAGRGEFGGIPSAAYIMLSEEDARQVIQDEAAALGVRMVPDGKTLQNIAVPITNRYAFLDRDEPSDEPVSRPMTLVLDGADGTKTVAYEYVSEEDFEVWETRNPRHAATVWEYDFLDTAQRLRDGLASAHPDGAYGVFYDPMVTVTPPANPDWKILEAEGKQLARKELKKQVRDFIAWLKAEDVI